MNPDATEGISSLLLTPAPDQRCLMLLLVRQMLLMLQLQMLKQQLL